MTRANNLRDTTLVDFSRALADVLIEPDVGHVHWADFDAWEACVEAGDAATTAAIPEIKAKIARERWRGIFRRSRLKRLAAWHLESGRHDQCVIDTVIPALEYQGALEPPDGEEVDEASEQPLDAAAAVEETIATVESVATRD